LSSQLDSGSDRRPTAAPSAARPKVCLVGGPDVDARQPLMLRFDRDFDVCAIGTEPSLATSFEARGLRYRTYAMTRGVSPLRDLCSLWQLVRIFRSERPRVVHTFDSKPAIWGRLAAKFARVPVVIGTLPGLGSLYSAPSWKGRIVRLMYQPLQTLACRWADLTIFQNHDDAREFTRRRVVPADRSLVIPGSGIPTDVFAPADEETSRARRAELGLDGSVVAVMISRVVRTKGVLDFAAAARTVRVANSDVRFVLVGPEDRSSLDALTPAELAELHGSLSWLGPRDDIRGVLSAADIFVFPSFYREGVPRVLLEAAAMGLPIVAADVPGSRDVVEDGVNGFLVAPRDPDAITEAVLRLAGAPELRRRFGQSSRHRAVSRFDLSEIAQRTESVYWDLLAAKQVS
jgi:glycosyltransferase involved in cell wall biosynthesis